MSLRLALVGFALARPTLAAAAAAPLCRQFLNPFTCPPLSRDFSSSASTMGITEWAAKDGAFKRQVSSFRDAIEEGGKFPPEKGRYHLYVSYACPWAHRTLIVRKLKGLEDFFDYSVVHPHLLEGGWHFVPPQYENQEPKPQSAHDNNTFPGATIDKINKHKMLSDLYFQADKEYNARFTVPVVWDMKENTIVSNESAEIIRFFNTAFNDQLQGEAKDLDLYPEELRSEIDELNAWVYDGINNGVYKCGFASTQDAYTEAAKNLVAAMDRLEKHLSDGREYLVGGRLTEADVRLFTTIVRYDPVYYVHFKCNWGMIRHDYPEVNRWLRNLYWNNAAFKDTTDFPHITEHYYYSHSGQNPHRIVPYGPNTMIEPLDGKRKAEDVTGSNKAAKV